MLLVLVVFLGAGSSSFGLQTARCVALEFVANKGQGDMSHKLSGRDLSLARMLGSTCLRHVGEIDQEIRRFYRGKSSMNVLRLGVTQIRYCDKIPDRAAVHESVELAKRSGANPGLCNAVLRKIAASEPLPASPELNASPWFRKKVASQCDNSSLFFEYQSARGEPTFDVTWVGRGEERPLPGFRRLECGSLRAEPGTPFPSDQPCFAQDAAAAAAGRIALDSLISERGRSRRILDACAAPGGKTMQLAAAGHDVTAVDVSETRVNRLRENLDRLALSAKVVAADVTDLRDPLGGFDLVLLDAPCTCTGTGRRHPEVLQKTGCGSLLKTQRKLLYACFDLTKVGGVLIYSTCSVLREENEDQIFRFLKEKSTSAKVWPIDPLDGFSPSATSSSGFLRLLPWHLSEKNEACDSHFVARLVRLS